MPYKVEVIKNLERGNWTVKSDTKSLTKEEEILFALGEERVILNGKYEKALEYYKKDSFSKLKGLVPLTHITYLAATRNEIDRQR